MNPRIALVPILAAAVLFVVFAQPAASTSSCPASQVYIGPYNKLTILPKGYKIVDKPFTVVAVRVEGGKETVLSNQRVSIYLYETDTKKVLVDSGRTDTQGRYTYTPTKLAKYMVECAGRAPTFETKKILTSSDLGAVCGDGKCETGKLENNENCPVDCTVCGDAKCEGDETKDNCPDDCIICGDGDCDPAEYWPSGCSCPEDCIVCGDGRCDEAHGETGETCPKDCKDGKNAVSETNEGGLLEENWELILAVIAAIAVLYVAVSRIRGRSSPEKRAKHGRGRKGEKDAKMGMEEAIMSDEEVDDIIGELMEQGMSEKRIRGKLKEFGLDGKEADDIVKKAKKRR